MEASIFQTYSALDHFSDYIDSINKDPNIPLDFILQIANYLPVTFTRRDVKEIIRKLKAYKYYENSDFIYKKLSGKSQVFPIINDNLKHELLTLYKITHKIYKEKFPLKSLPSIHFVLSKLLSLLNAPEDIKILFTCCLSGMKKENYNKIWEEIEPELIRQISILH